MSEEVMEQARILIRDLTDPDDCWFDHNGGCQAHGYLYLERGQLCPHEEAKQWLKDNADQEVADEQR